MQIPKDYYYPMVFFRSTIFLYFLTFNLLTLPLFSEEIPIQSTSPQDKEWKVFYLNPEGYVTDSSKQSLFQEIFDSHPKSQPVAVFLYSGYHSEVSTNRKKKISYFGEFSHSVEEDDINDYSSFLRMHCRLPTNVEFKLEKAGKLKGTYQSRKMEEVECEKDLISRTWKGNGFPFWMHSHYYRIPDVTNINEIPGFLLYIGTVLGIAFLSMGMYYFLLRILLEKFPRSLNPKMMAIFGCLILGFLLMAVGGLVNVFNESSPLGISYYFTMLFLLAGVYTILCFLPFWGLVNYKILGDDTFPLWLILLGFFLAPVLIFAAGGLKSGSRTVSTGNSSSGSSSSSSSSNSSSTTGQGGTFGGGGASGSW